VCINVLFVFIYTVIEGINNKDKSRGEIGWIVENGIISPLILRD